MNTFELMRVAIACGGTGGHLFPGLAVAECLRTKGCRVTLLVSPKDVDQQGVKEAVGMEVLTLPAVGLKRGGELAFLRGFIRSYRSAKNAFRTDPPVAALAMGGFTSAPPMLAARSFGAPVFLHESNSIPGRANRWLSWMVTRAFTAFPSASRRLHTPNVNRSGTPVRSRFQPADPAACRIAFGLAPDRPVVLVMGGSQGAAGINSLVTRALGQLPPDARVWQWLHLTGAGQEEEVRAAYAKGGLAAKVFPFLAEMHAALGAATVVVSRAGASSLAEMAAVRVPSVLIPYPLATDNHQWHNAHEFELAGAAKILEQKSATPQELLKLLGQIIGDDQLRSQMQAAVAAWHTPDAARDIASAMIEAAGRKHAERGVAPLAKSASSPGKGAGGQTRCSALSS